MKIIKRAYKTPIERIECNTCHSVLEITQEDVKLDYQYNQEERYVICPICRMIIKLDPKRNYFNWTVDSDE